MRADIFIGFDTQYRNLKEGFGNLENPHEECPGFLETLSTRIDSAKENTPMTHARH